MTSERLVRSRSAQKRWLLVVAGAIVVAGLAPFLVRDVRRLERRPVAEEAVSPDVVVTAVGDAVHAASRPTAVAAAPSTSRRVRGRPVDWQSHTAGIL